MAFDTTLRWVNFRSSLAYVTDGANQSFMTVDGSAFVNVYPTSITVGGAGTNMGRENTVLQTRNRSTSGDVRLAGGCFVTQNSSAFSDFRVVLPAAGQYNIYLASGDLYAHANTYIAIYDDVTLLKTSVDSATGPGANQFYDAMGTLHTSRANWAANNAPFLGTFASAILRIRVGKAAFASGDCFLNTLGIQQVLSGSTLTPGVGSVVVAGLGGVLTKERAIAPAQAALTLAGLSASELRERVVAPGAALVTAGGLSPSALGQDQIAPTAGTIQTQGLAPTLLTERVIAPAVGAATLAGQVPSLILDQSIAGSSLPDTGGLIIQGLVPTLDTTSDASLGRGHVESGRRWHGRGNRYDFSETASVAVSDAFPTEAPSPIQPLGALPLFKPLESFPIGVELPSVSPNWRAESKARIAKKRRRREEEFVLLSLL